MADVIGVRHTGNVQQANRKPDVKDKILLLEPEAAPLVVLTSKIGSGPTGNPKFSWFEDELQPRIDAINNGAGYTNVATSLVVDNGPYFGEDDLVKVTRTGEVMRVSSVAANTLTVVRGVGGGNQALVDNDELYIIGSMRPEFDTANEPRTDNENEVFNYTQIWRRGWKASRTWQQSDQWTRPKDFEYQAEKAMIEHKKDQELTFWHGKPSENLAATPGALRSTGGVYHFCTQNIKAVGGALTEDAFFDHYNALFRYGRKSKMAFGARATIAVINKFPRGKLEVIQADNDSTFGLQIMKYQHPLGTLNFVAVDLFDDSTEYREHINVLDMEVLRKRYLTGGEYGDSDLLVRENIQDNSADGRLDEILSECGLEIGEPKKHGRYEGITS